jgi:hypothetical protein
MRKRLVVLLTVTIALVLLQPIATAAVKAGAKCSKAGATSISAGKKFTCIKSGNTLVWNKGVVVKKPTPVATPTPSPTPTATPTIAPTPTATSTPKAPTSFDDLVENYQGIAYAAWSKSREKILASKKTDITLKMIMGPSSQLTYKEPLIPIDLVSRMYSGNVEPIEIYYLAFNYADREWAVNQMESILPNSGSRWVTDVACRTQATCWGGGSFYNGSNRYLIVLAVELQTPEHMNGTVEAHEFTHTVQQMNIKKGRPAQEFLYDPWPPTWYWEGQAHFTNTQQFSMTPLPIT